MDIRLTFALCIGKLISFLSQKLATGGGSAAPGLLALKIEPSFVQKLARQIPRQIFITGTNGKTTTARLLSHILAASGYHILRNKTGSNLERGVASALINAFSFQDKKYDLAIWELDEASFNQLSPILNPQIIVFLNVFRDQLDRYGEIDTVIKNWRQTLSQISPQTKIFLNGNDHNLLTLKKAFFGQVQTFGLDSLQIEGEKMVQKIQKSVLNFKASQIKTSGLKGSSFIIEENTVKTKVDLPLPGIYHIYDFLASFACAKALGLSSPQIISSLKKFLPAFGRVEKVYLKDGQKEAFIFLIKNPAGAAQVFQTIENEIKKEDRLLIALNDNLADGRDVSWIWDAPFERLASKKILTHASGDRAFDLALRLKYAGFSSSLILTEEDLKKAFHLAQEDLVGRLFILPTYTALLKLQNILVKEGLKDHYWKGG